MWFRFYVFETDAKEMTWIDVLAVSELDASSYVIQEGFPSWEIYHHLMMGSDDDLRDFKWFSEFPYKSLHRKARSFYAAMLQTHNAALGIAKRRYENGSSYAQMELPF